MKDVIIKKSNIDQFDKGAFANRDFRKGKIVIRYHLTSLTEEEYHNLSEEEKKFTHSQKGVIHLYSEPERYVNHSNNPNTVQDLKNMCDIAIRDIINGEEITTDARKDDIF
ncbi:SET domain-containing protein [Candidatus Pacearchaeota archaeon]|nr:SET domain-containing protein [Candidatus Pacearchaeota archaeon]